MDAVGEDTERMVTAESEAAGWEEDEGSGAGGGQEESEWEVVEDGRQGEGSRVQDLTSSRAWRQFLKRRDGHLLDDEALVIVDLVREACKHHTCAAPARDESYQGGALQQAHDGMGLVSWRSGMCWHAQDRDGEDRGGRQRRGARGPRCRVADHVRQLEALTVCLERLCGHPTRQVALAAVSCVRAFACIPLLLASEQCPRLARACLPLLAPHSLPPSLPPSLTHFELRRCPSELGLVAACANAPLGDRMRAISAISACILRDQVRSAAMLRSCRASSSCPTLPPPHSPPCTLSSGPCSLGGPAVFAAQITDASETPATSQASLQHVSGAIKAIMADPDLGLRRALVTAAGSWLQLLAFNDLQQPRNMAPLEILLAALHDASRPVRTGVFRGVEGGG